MTKNTKAVVLGDQDCGMIIESINEINIARMDASVLHNSIVDLLESFEYRERDKEAIDSLYTFTRFLGTCLETIKASHHQIDDAINATSGAA
jgi:hypothetical protein